MIQKFMKKNKTVLIKLIFTFGLNTAFALPTDPIVEFGDVKFDSSNIKALNITTSDKAIINWNDFSINMDEVTKFIQPANRSVVLNRVVGDNISDILGKLEANGIVYIINPNGFLFGENSIIDTGSFTASTLDVLNETFLENLEILFKGSSQESIINLGTIQSKDGDVTLLGHIIDNQGTIKAPNGCVSLAAGTEILLKPNSEEKIFIKPQIKDETSNEEIGINNSGYIQAIQIKIQAEGNPYQYAIKHDGEIDALGISTKDGKVFLIANDGVNIINGKIIAKNENDTRAEVRLIGDYVQLLDEANIDVSANKNGGTVLIGGDYQGKHSDIINARAVFVAQEAQINASSIEDGNGGKVILWSDELTQFYGNIKAQGGKNSGDGGFVEVSSKNILEFKGKVDVLAPFGEIGNLLLDPCEVTVDVFGGIGTSVPVWVNPYIPATNTASLAVADLTNALTTANVTIDAISGAGAGSGNIILDTAVIWAGPAGGSRLTMIGNTIYINDDIRFVNATAADTTLILDLQAPTILIGAPLGVPGNHANAISVINDTGIFQIQASTMLGIYGGNIAASDVSVFAGTAGSAGSGVMNVSVGDLIIRGGSGATSPVILGVSNVGSLTINATGDVTVEGGSGLGSSAFFRTSTGDINLNMTGDNKTLTCRGNNAVAMISSAISGDVFVNMTGLNNDCVITGGVTTQSAGAMIATANQGKIACDITGDYIITGQGSDIDGVTGVVSGQNAIGGSVTLSGRNLYCTGGTKPGANFVFIGAQSGFLEINMTNLISIEGGSADGTNAVLMAREPGVHDVRINTHSLILRGSSSAVTDARGAIITEYGNLEINASGDVSLLGGTAGADNSPMILSAIEGSLTISSNNLSLISGAGGAAALTTPSGDINITTARALNLQGTSAYPVNIETQGSNMIIKAGTNIIMGSYSSIVNSGSGDLTLICDNLYPSSPYVGTGRFSMDATATLSTTNGELRIFGARQSVNSIKGSLNGSFFTEGPLYRDTLKERWGVYYPDLFGGDPFTIFYKDTPGILITLAEPLLVAMAEVFRDLHSYNEFFRWSIRYYVEDYLKKHDQFYLSENSEQQSYFIRRRDRAEANVYLRKK